MPVSCYSFWKCPSRRFLGVSVCLLTTFSQAWEVEESAWVIASWRYSVSRTISTLMRSEGKKRDEMLKYQNIGLWFLRKDLV